MQVDFKINYKDQDVSLIHKIIEKVNMAILVFLIIKVNIINNNF